MSEQVKKLWQDHHRCLLSFINRRVNNEAVAEDILQNVFVRIQSRINTLKNENKMTAWLYQITRNAIIDYYRTYKPMEELPESLKMPTEDSTEKARLDIQSCLEPMINKLPDKYRQALIISELEGQPQKMLAQTQGLSLSGAKSRIQRARVMLKNMMLECCHFEYDHRGKLIDYVENTGSCESCGK